MALVFYKSPEEPAQCAFEISRALKDNQRLQVRGHSQRAGREQDYVWWKGDTRPLHQTIDSILAQGPSAIAPAADTWFACALAERDPAAAERALLALGDNPCWHA